MASFVRVNLVRSEESPMELLVNSDHILWLVPQPDGTTVIQLTHPGNDEVRQLHVHEPPLSITRQM